MEHFGRETPDNPCVEVDGDLTLGDSKVICQYLEEAYPEPALYPQAIADKAMAHWYEDLCSGRIAELAAVLEKEAMGEATRVRKVRAAYPQSTDPMRRATCPIAAIHRT